MMIKAAVLVGQNEPLHIKEFQVKAPTGHQVLVKIFASGICGAQINEIRGIKGPDQFLPHLMGHEGSGLVEAVGDKVTKVVVGDRVVLHWRKASGGEGPFPRYETAEGDFAGGGFVTSFASMALIAENRVTRVDADIPFDIASLFGCGISTGYGIVINELKLKAGSSLAVVGCGGVGLNVIQAASLAGAAEVLAVDRVAGNKESLSLDMGATRFLQLGAPAGLDEGLRGLRAKGFDAVVDTTGDAALMGQAFKALTKNGTLMLVGQPHFSEKLVLDPALDLFTGKRLLVSEGGGFDPDPDMPKLQELYRRNPAAMHKVITHSFELDRINDAITTMRGGACGRVIIDTQATS